MEIEQSRFMDVAILTKDERAIVSCLDSFLGPAGISQLCSRLRQLVSEATLRQLEADGWLHGVSGPSGENLYETTDRGSQLIEQQKENTDELFS